MRFYFLLSSEFFQIQHRVWATLWSRNVGQARPVSCTQWWQGLWKDCLGWCNAPLVSIHMLTNLDKLAFWHHNYRNNKTSGNEHAKIVRVHEMPVLCHCCNPRLLNIRYTPFKQRMSKCHVWEGFCLPDVFSKELCTDLIGCIPANMC